MNWEKRGKSDYYYRKYRIGDQVISEYVGNDHIAQLIADEDTLVRQLQLAAKGKKGRQKKFELVMDRKADQVCREVNTLVQSLLLISGYHMHQGQWKKRRE